MLALLPTLPQAESCQVYNRSQSHDMNDALPETKRTPQHRHMWVAAGPAGCGKSTVGQFLAEQLRVPYIEGDDVGRQTFKYDSLRANSLQYHSPSNVAKMARGAPLTDEDRADWLVSLRTAAVDALTHTISTEPPHSGVVVSCSALKRIYRDALRLACKEDHAIKIHFLFLTTTEEALSVRVRARQGHYMKEQMVHSQFAILEEPDESEPKDVIPIDCTTTMSAVEKNVVRKVRELLAADESSEDGMSHR